ncbi:MAG TPA: ribosome silencing factor [Verrucomicrobia bacterium]|nr:ribosome silencing factor [Verrucomicrobiota bacterium]
MTIESKALAERIHAILDEKKAEHITLIDVRGSSTVTDYTIIASGMSAPHIRALYEDVQHQLKQEGMPCYRRSGETEGGWMVLDYVNVVVHLFLPEVREYYALETLWDEPATAMP